MTPKSTTLWRWRFLRWGVYLGLLLTLYGGSYIWLSRRGMAEIEAVGGDYFLYCPLSDLKRKGLPLQHMIASAVFYPINQLDRAWFGGGSPCSGMTTWSLEGE